MLLESYDLQLFAKDGEGGEKTEEPTTKKLSDARKNGQVAKSTDLTTAFCLLVFFIILKQYLGTLGNDFLEQFHFFYSKISDYTNTNFTLQLACATAWRSDQKHTDHGVAFFSDFVCFNSHCFSDAGKMEDFF